MKNIKIELFELIKKNSINKKTIMNDEQLSKELECSKPTIHSLLKELEHEEIIKRKSTFIDKKKIREIEIIEDLEKIYFEKELEKIICILYKNNQFEIVNILINLELKNFDFKINIQDWENYDNLNWGNNE